jgi:hypothetical protein
MRNSFLTLAPMLLSASLSAQGVFSNKTQVVLEKVIQDYPNHFYNIKGELISQALQTSQYRSTLQLPGSASSTITVATGSGSGGSTTGGGGGSPIGNEGSATGGEGSGWTCTVLETHNFGEAKEKYAAIYGQLSNSIITTAGQKTFILSGQYEAPAEEKKSTCIIFSLLPCVGDMKKLKVELALQEEEGGKWKIVLCVEDKDPKEEAQGAITAN